LKIANLFETTHSTTIPLKKESPLKILLLVEPTPFNYVSGYANRFKEMLRFLKLAGDDVRVLTPDADPNPPKTFLDFPITTVRGFEFPLYKQVTLSFDLRFKIPKIIEEFDPDIIHVSTPSALIWPAVFWSLKYNKPLVMSYHTNFVEYAKTYSKLPGSVQLAKFLLKSFHNFADLTLCTSPQLKNELVKCGVRRVDVWEKGIDNQVKKIFIY
jgi:sulfoquinovosyltransferase